MSPPRFERLRSALGRVPFARRLHARLTVGGVILLYHRITTLREDPFALCVSPARFEEHLQVIRRYANPMRLSDMVRTLRAGRLPTGAVCITFDDGYADNLHEALPLLERYEVPATMFVTTGRIGRDREFWWDELERVVLEPPVLPERLELDLFDHRLALDLGSSAMRGADQSADEPGWNLGAEFDPTPRHAAFRTIYDILQPRSPREQIEALGVLAQWSGVAPGMRESHRALEPDGVLQLVRSEVIDIGSHTVDHPALCSQPRDAQRVEVTASRATLEDWLGQPVESFSYPYGLYSGESVEEVKRAGYTHACACIGRPAGRKSDPWELPRVDAPDVGGEAFAEQLSTLFGRRIGPWVGTGS